MTLYSGFTETAPVPRPRGVGLRRWARVGDVAEQAAGVRHAVRDDAGHPLCSDSVRIVLRLVPFGPQVGGMNLRTGTTCAALAADEPNVEAP